MYKLLAKIFPKINWKKVEYRLSVFDYVKCADCDYDGKADAYCKPPLGACSFKEKENDQKSHQSNQTNMEEDIPS